jgi:hypothetical protein
MGFIEDIQEATDIFSEANEMLYDFFSKLGEYFDQLLGWGLKKI